jgi:hypothetical protein
MYDSNHFDKNKMLDWEKQPTATKTDYDATKAYFEALVKATDTYEMNARGGTAGCNKYKLANQLADYGNEIREYIAKIASSSASAANNHAANANARTKQFAEMAAQIKVLTAAVTQLAVKKENANQNANGGNGSGDRESRRPQMKKNTKHGGILSLPWLSPSRHQPRQCNVQLEKRGA